MSLEKEARKMKSCDDYKHGVNYRVLNIGTRENKAIWKEFVKDSAKNSTRTYYLGESSHPLQSSFIKCKLTTPCQLDALRVNNFLNYSTTFITLYGWR